ncbi:flagellar motor protein MotB [Brevibacillus agri]
MHDDRLYDEKELEKSWLISYSDLITLLFVIVIIIAATQMTKIQTQREAAKKEQAEQQANLKQVHESLDLLNLQKLELEREIHQLEGQKKALTGTMDEKGTQEQEQAQKSVPKPPVGMPDTGERGAQPALVRFGRAESGLRGDRRGIAHPPSGENFVRQWLC